MFPPSTESCTKCEQFWQKTQKKEVDTAKYLLTVVLTVKSLYYPPISTIARVVREPKMV